MDHSVRVVDTPDPEIRAAILDGLIAYNTRQTGIADLRPIAVALADAAGQTVGGLWGRTAYGWLFVELLFVPESLRGRGVGADLMRRAEDEARVRGCRAAWLDTFSFQARGFYERLGYTSFGVLNDYPPGFSRYFMHKLL